MPAAATDLVRKRPASVPEVGERGSSLALTDGAGWDFFHGAGCEAEHPQAARLRFPVHEIIPAGWEAARRRSSPDNTV
jgi:hypothetical protein